jgi:hypothetical protein
MSTRVGAMSDIKVSLEEAKELFMLLEKLQDFMHQPMNYDSQEKFEAFVSSIYPEVSDAYYKKVWNWLPKEVQREIEER